MTIRRAIFSSDIVVVRRIKRKSFGGYVVAKRRFKLFGRVIWSSDLEYEDYPSWAHIETSTLGFSDWTSKLAAKYLSHPGCDKNKAASSPT